MNLSPILNGQRKTLTVDAEYSVSQLENQQDIRYLSPLKIKGIIRQTAEFMTMEIHIETEVAVPCARCLAESVYPIDIDSEVHLLASDDLSWDDEYDSFIIENDKVDLLEIANVEIIQEIPIQPLCDEDCLGLCPRCGKNLNLEECDCEPETDSRFDILKELLK